MYEYLEIIDEVYLISNYAGLKLIATQQFLETVDFALLQIGGNSLRHFRNALVNFSNYSFSVSSEKEAQEEFMWVLMSYMEYVNTTYYDGHIEFHTSGRGARF